MKPTSRLLLPILAAGLALGACGDLGTGANLRDGEARVSILLTDAPGDLRAAVVTITDIYLTPRDGTDPERVHLLQNASVTTDLLTLSNDVLELVEGKTVPAGSYAQLRFVISGAYIEVERPGGASAIYATSGDYAGLPAGVRVTGELVCPSCSQSGFKVVLAGAGDEVEVPERTEQTLLVDFDVSQSFGHQAGNSGRWILKPTLKAAPARAAGSVTVTLSRDASLALPNIGGSALTLGGFQATLAPAAGGDPKTVPLVDANNDGVFEATFRHLLPGEYRAAIAGPAGVTFTTDRTAPVTVTVGSGGTVTTAFKLTSATAS